MSLFRRKASVTAETVHQRPAPPFDNLGNFIIVVLDSCRFDTFMEASPRNIIRLSDPCLRYSYASWTAPSHYNMLMGLMPHTNPPGVFASEYYKKDFVKFNQRLGAREIEFKSLVPKLYLPDYLRDTLGYRTHAMVSLPVLNSFTPLNSGFDTFRLMEKHNDLDAMLSLMTFPSDRPSFYMLNTGETHYPYATPDEPENEWPRISGVHGVFKHLDDHTLEGGADGEEDTFFDEGQMKALRARQVNAVKWLDKVFEHLFDIVPKNTWITVTSDHGELFGEGGFFGHGPVCHEKVFQVPFLEGGVR